MLLLAWFSSAWCHFQQLLVSIAACSLIIALRCFFPVDLKLWVLLFGGTSGFRYLDQQVGHVGKRGYRADSLLLPSPECFKTFLVLEKIESLFQMFS
jgi:hypothetical protein